MPPLPTAPEPINLNFPHPSIPVRLAPGEFWGVPAHLFERPAVTDALLRYLEILERRSLPLLPPTQWLTRLRQCRPRPPFALQPEQVWTNDKRDVWSVPELGVVIKDQWDGEENQLSGNVREAINDCLYRDHVKGVWVHFPVWGRTPGARFLVMARADAILFLNSEITAELEQAVIRHAKPYIVDAIAKNIGARSHNGNRYWASVDIDWGDAPVPPKPKGSKQEVSNDS